MSNAAEGMYFNPGIFKAYAGIAEGDGYGGCDLSRKPGVNILPPKRNLSYGYVL